ncbi:MAG: XRE family transcriptional regulator [bacterium]|nr:XRE family transcriptional regulator [bacterium]
MNEKIELVRGSGNIFKDLGLPDADVRQTKVLLASKIIKILDERELSTRQAESLTGVSHSEFSRLRKPDLKRFTIDRLITILNKLGQKVDVSFTITARQNDMAPRVHA